MNWTALAILGLLLTFLGIFNLQLRRKKVRSQILGDKEALRIALANWEPLVLEHEKTMRSVKRFANRARFMMNDEPDSIIQLLVGLIALDEIGLMDHPLNPIDNESDLDKWKQMVSEKLVISDSDERSASVKDWLGTLTPVDWNRYQTLATQGRTLGNE